MKHLNLLESRLLQSYHTNYLKLF